MEQKIESQSDFLDLQRKQADIIEQKEMAASSIPELESQISEMQKKKEELIITFKARAQKELAEEKRRADHHLQGQGPERTWPGPEKPGILRGKTGNF